MANMNSMAQAWEVIDNGFIKEMTEFRRTMYDKPSAEVYKHWYKIGFYEEYNEMLMTDYAEEHLTDNEVEWIAKMIYDGINFLAFLYEEWLSADGPFSHDWDDMIDFIRTVYEEEED